MNMDRETLFKVAMIEEIDRAHYQATKKTLLEHARMGRSVCESDANGQVIWIPPAEIFARYGLDEFGRPVASEPQATNPSDKASSS